MPLSPDHHDQLRVAVGLLENPGFTARLTQFLGKPVERLMHSLPATATDAIHRATRMAIQKAMNAALSTIQQKSTRPASNRLHRVLTGTSGFVGGFFGLAGLAVELPLSTTVMLRSIADIARSHGEDLTSTDTSLACIEVFALGGKSKNQEAVETGYYAVRAALAQTISEAAKFIVKRGLVNEGAPILVRFITQVAGRFSTVVTEKVAVQAVPAIGAVAGATINVLFTKHFQDLAAGHFIVRKLERIYGGQFVRAEYERLAAGEPTQSHHA